MADVLRFNEMGDLVLWEDAEKSCYIPAKHIRIIYENLKSGKSFVECSPMYSVTREQVAFILNNFKYRKG